MTGRQEYDRTKDRQRILGKYMIDAYNLYSIPNVYYVEWENGILSNLFYAFLTYHGYTIKVFAVCFPYKSFNFYAKKNFPNKCGGNRLLDQGTFVLPFFFEKNVFTIYISFNLFVFGWHNTYIKHQRTENSCHFRYLLVCYV